MIKVAISGADTPAAGEIIRILVNHPDVEIISLVAPGHEGKQVQALHHGLLGEEKIPITGSARLDSADVLFIADNNLRNSDYNRLRKAYPDLKVIALNPLTEDVPVDEEPPVYALPEINRKALVRGAKTAVLPSPVASIALVSLFPLAKNLLLNGDLMLNISAPSDIVSKELLEKSAEEITLHLNEAQRSFHGAVSFNILPPSSKRGIEMTTSLNSPLDITHILSTYEIYDDHNFSYPVLSPVKLDDVKGTEKVIISLSLSKDGVLSIHSVADGRLRGNAGEAVHVMNLMFGLHEKTGLYLKPYAF
ncbi:MAG: hypothetical protein K2H18_06650 [Muribaculaceae bacterium]|nr:hypothetical protein [Muribaculaceae bacterium]